MISWVFARGLAPNGQADRAHTSTVCSAKVWKILIWRGFQGSHAKFSKLRQPPFQALLPSHNKIVRVSIKPVTQTLKSSANLCQARLSGSPESCHRKLLAHLQDAERKISLRQVNLSQWQARALNVNGRAPQKRSASYQLLLTSKARSRSDNQRR